MYRRLFSSSGVSLQLLSVLVISVGACRVAQISRIGIVRMRRDNEKKRIPSINKRRGKPSKTSRAGLKHSSVFKSNLIIYQLRKSANLCNLIWRIATCATWYVHFQWCSIPNQRILHACTREKSQCCTWSCRRLQLFAFSSLSYNT